VLAKTWKTSIASAKQAEQQLQLMATAAAQQTSALGEVSESAGPISQLSIENALKNLAALAGDLDGMIPSSPMKKRANPAADRRTFSQVWRWDGACLRNSPDIARQKQRSGDLSLARAFGFDRVALWAVRVLNFRTAHGSEFMVRCCFVAAGLW
jgi:hypothetical protein